MKCNPEKISVVVIANPNLLVAPELILWLLDAGIPRRNILISRGDDRDQVAAYNQAVRMALAVPMEACLFADNDVRPDWRLTEPLLNMPFDFTCARTNTELGADSWREQDAFHSALWIARRQALAMMPSPWFKWNYSPDGSQIEGCVCQHFSNQAKRMGLTIGNAGWAKHYPRERCSLPTSVVLK